MDGDLVVPLVGGPQAAEHLRRGLQGGLSQLYRLEPPLKRSVLIEDQAPVLVSGGGANAADLPPCQHGLHEVSRIHVVVLRPARAKYQVQLVNEEQLRTMGLPKLLKHCLQPVLEVPPHAGARQERADVQGPQLLAVLELPGHLACRNSLRNGLGHGRLAHAGRAHEADVVLRPPGEDLQRPRHLRLPADHGVQAPGFGQLH
mmetsp:Transcript_20881/g.58950  ORF Transcript_20881/g.58950 Transcript_20881/m.58950 type:complete len:202 (+) Transcript_20881:312-917(+)